MPGPRVIEVFLRPYEPYFTTNSKTPDIPHVCQESRNEALRFDEVLKLSPCLDELHYELEQKFDKYLRDLELSGVDVSGMEWNSPAEKDMQTDVDYDSDILYLPMHYYGSNCSEFEYHAVEFIIEIQRLRRYQTSAKIKYTALQHDILQDLEGIFSLLELFVTNKGDDWTEMKEVYMVFDDEGNHGHEFVHGRPIRNSKALGWNQLDPEVTKLVGYRDAS